MRQYWQIAWLPALWARSYASIFIQCYNRRAPRRNNSTESADPLLGMVKLMPERVFLRPNSLYFDIQFTCCFFPYFFSWYFSALILQSMMLLILFASKHFSLSLKHILILTAIMIVLIASWFLKSSCLTPIITVWYVSVT